MRKILLIRLGAMGDVLHAMPAVTAVRNSFPHAELAWVLEPRWMPLLAGTGLVNHLLPLERRSASSVLAALRWLRRWGPDLAIDFQGLWKSALVGLMSGAKVRLGFAAQCAREREAAVVYTEAISAGAAHVVDKNLQLVSRFGGAAGEITMAPGHGEGKLPKGNFVLGAPYAGWRSKQWPIENYVDIARRLRHEQGLTLVMNVMSGQELPEGEYLWRHDSSLEGLIDATRRAHGVLGLDSGPMHLAAMMKKPGVALFGPTDPARNGPYGKTMKALRVEGAATTYKRDGEIAPSMTALTPDAVWAALRQAIA